MTRREAAQAVASTHLGWRVAASLALTAALACIGASGAAAQGYGRHGGYGDRSYVVAESHWGNGTVSGPVRPGRHGWQVRLPRGTWIDCERNNCSETLRRATVDFWQAQGNYDAKDSGPGYFRWEFRY